MAQERLRRNRRIRISPIRLIDAEGSQVGIVETDQAMAMAMEAELDLVEVAPQARPPVCRIMDYGKWMYAQKKKDRKAKAHRHETVMKEVQIRTPKIGSHDLGIKVNRAREFLERGDRVQFTLRFRGREMAHQDLGRDVLNSVKAILADISKVERDFRMEGRRLTMVLASTIKSPPVKKASPAAAPAASAPAHSGPVQSGSPPAAAPEPMAENAVAPEPEPAGE